MPHANDWLGGVLAAIYPASGPRIQYRSQYWPDPTALVNALWNPYASAGLSQEQRTLVEACRTSLFFTASTTGDLLALLAFYGTSETDRIQLTNHFNSTWVLFAKDYGEEYTHFWKFLRSFFTCDRSPSGQANDVAARTLCARLRGLLLNDNLSGLSIPYAATWLLNFFVRDHAGLADPFLDFRTQFVFELSQLFKCTDEVDPSGALVLHPHIETMKSLLTSVPDAASLEQFTMIVRVLLELLNDMSEFGHFRALLRRHVERVQHGFPQAVVPTASFARTSPQTNHYDHLPQPRHPQWSDAQTHEHGRTWRQMVHTDFQASRPREQQQLLGLQRHPRPSRRDSSPGRPQVRLSPRWQTPSPTAREQPAYPFSNKLGQSGRQHRREKSPQAPIVDGRKLSSNNSPARHTRNIVSRSGIDDGYGPPPQPSPPSTLRPERPSDGSRKHFVRQQSSPVSAPFSQRDVISKAGQFKQRVRFHQETPSGFASSSLLSDRRHVKVSSRPGQSQVFVAGESFPYPPDNTVQPEFCYNSSDCDSPDDMVSNAMAATMDHENGYTANDLGSPPESDEIGKHHFPFNNFDSDDDDDDDDHS